MNNNLLRIDDNTVFDLATLAKYGLITSKGKGDKAKLRVWVAGQDDPDDTHIDDVALNLWCHLVENAQDIRHHAQRKRDELEQAKMIINNMLSGLRYGLLDEAEEELRASVKNALDKGSEELYALEEGLL